MKIYKSTLNSLLEDVPGKLYLCGTRSTSGDQMPMVTYIVTVAGYNAEGQACELRIAQPAVYKMVTEHVRQAHDANGELLEEIKTRLNALGRTYSDGVLSEEPVLGALD